MDPNRQKMIAELEHLEQLQREYQEKLWQDREAQAKLEFEKKMQEQAKNAGAAKATPQKGREEGKKELHSNTVPFFANPQASPFVEQTPQPPKATGYGTEKKNLMAGYLQLFILSQNRFVPVRRSMRQAPSVPLLRRNNPYKEYVRWSRPHWCPRGR